MEGSSHALLTELMETHFLPPRSGTPGIVGRSLTILRRNRFATGGIAARQKQVTDDIIKPPVV